MWRRKSIPEEEESIPDDIIKEVFDRMQPLLEEMINKKVKQHTGALAEKLAHDIGKLLAAMDKEIRSIKSEVKEVKEVSGLSLDKVIRDILSAQTFVIVREAAKEVVEEIGVGRIQLMDSYITDMETRVDDLISTVNTARESIEEFREVSSEIKSELAKERQELSKLRSDVASIVKQVKKQLTDEMEVLKEEIRSSISIDGIDVSNMLKESVEAIFREKLTAIEERLFEATQNIQHVAESVTGLAVVAEKFEELEGAILSLTEEVRRLEQRRTNLQEKAEAVKLKQNAKVKVPESVPEDEVSGIDI